MSDESSNTAGNSPRPIKMPPGIPFQKGDPRINRKGRPRDFAAWRRLAQAILKEMAKDQKGDPVIIDGHIATKAEMIAREWADDPKQQQLIIEAAYGKVPQPMEINATVVTASVSADEMAEARRKAAEEEIAILAEPAQESGMSETEREA